MKNENNETELKIQADCYTWFNNNFPHLRGLLYHVPNGEKRNIQTANRLKAAGVVPGIPDLVLHFRKRTYFIEMKKPGGSLSEAQKKIHAVLDSQGFTVWIVDNLEDFKGLINNILNDTSQQFTLGLPKKLYLYRHKVFSYLYSMTDAEIVLVENVCEKENQQNFINCISDFIVEGYDKLEGFEILFTPDYKAFYKKVIGSEKEVIYNGKTVI